MPCGNQYIDLLCKTVAQFIHCAVFNTGGYFEVDHHALACRSFSMSLSSSVLNLALEIQNIERFSNIEVSLLFPY